MYKEKPDILDYVLSLPNSEEYLMHYGMPRRSGRYPYGSGDNPYQHNSDFIDRVNELRKQNFTYTDETGKTYSGDTAIAKSMGLSTGNFRVKYSLEKDRIRALRVATARGLREKGYSLNEIADKMGYKNDSSVRTLLDDNREYRTKQAEVTAKFIKEQVDSRGFIDVGEGVERELNISRQKLDEALSMLELEGYHVYGGRIPQVTNPNQKTTLKVICPPGTEHKEIFDYGKINSLKEYISRDDGDSYEKKFNFPSSMDPDRLQIRYKEDGGIDKDGLIELRRGVDDLSLGNSHYAQVRILVGDNKYIKGMAVYSDDLPDGVDVVFNTNKSKNVPKLDVLKNAKTVKVKDPKTGEEKEIVDPENPFGSLIKPIDEGGQYWYIDSNGNKKLGLINKRSDEGDWNDWSDKLPSQFLSKQTTTLAKRQLSIKLKETEDEFNAINSLTNPTVKKALLEEFANTCDSAAVHLYAAALPRQKYHVIIPITSLKDNEIYAPKYEDGEKVALVRFPHGGTFEIPILTVNNKNSDAKNTITSDALDAIGINSKVAERLSGADFDGDTVMVIPTNSKVKISSKSQLEGLKGFDPKMEYGTVKKEELVYDKSTGKYEKQDVYYNAQGTKVQIMKNTQNEMGRISNLITDMTLQGASDEELARAVRHSMVVIDAEKHKLDYRQSYQDNGIETLKKTYQEGGASTLISRAKSEDNVDKRQGSPKINLKFDKNGNPNPNYDSSRPEGAYIYKTADDLYYPERSYNKTTKMVTLRTVEGKKVTYSVEDKANKEYYEPIQRKNPKTGETYFTNKDGSIMYRMNTKHDTITKMEKTDDARTLISKTNTGMEQLYADYANSMKHLANQSRVIFATTGKIKYDKNAAQVYKSEVDELDKALQKAELNKPRERMAQAIANSRIKSMIQSNPDMTKDEIKKRSQQELTKARNEVGASRYTIDVTEKQWEAIQAGAISETKLKDILNNADMDKIREYATPKQFKTLTSAKQNRIDAMRNSGLTINQIASALGVSAATVTNYLSKKGETNG